VRVDKAEVRGIPKTFAWVNDSNLFDPFLVGIA